MGEIAIAVTTPTTWAMGLNYWSMPFFNVSMTVVAIAALGSLLSFAWGEREEDKGRLYFTALASTFLAIVGVVVFPRMMGWEWVDEANQAPLAGLIAIGARHALPHVITLIPDILRKIFRLDSKGDVATQTERSDKDAIE